MIPYRDKKCHTSQRFRVKPLVLRTQSKDKSKASFVCPTGFALTYQDQQHKHQKEVNQEKRAQNLTERSLNNLKKIKRLTKNSDNFVFEHASKISRQLFPSSLPFRIKTEQAGYIQYGYEEEDYEKVKLTQLVAQGSFGKIYKGFLRSKPYQEIIIKKVQIDPDHISHEEELSKKLRNAFIVNFLGTYHTKEKENAKKSSELAHQKNEQRLSSPQKSFKNQCERNFLNILMDKYETDLKTVILSQKINPLMQKLFLYQMLRALNYLHSQKICHRDIKPDNFLIKGAKIVLCDFGSAKILDPQNPTRSVTYIQQRPYRAPQLLMDCPGYDLKVDIWAIGCIAAQMARGTLLFNGESNLDQIVKILRVIPSPNWRKLSFLQKQGKSIPKIPQIVSLGLQTRFQPNTDLKLINLLKRMLNFEPNQRITALQALCDSYFMELRDQSFLKQIPRGVTIPNLYHFTKRQLAGNEHLANTLVPFWVREHCKRDKISIKDFTFYS